MAADLGNWGDELTNTIKETGYKDVDQTPEAIVGKIIKAALSLIGVVFLILIVYGGYLWMTASGNEERLKKAKTIITNATVGLIIVLMAYAITYFIVEQVTGAAQYQ